MTPIEQDKNLREQLIELDGELWDYQLDKLVQLITADRKRVASEARIDEVKHSLYQGYFIPEMEVYAESRIAKLKAQQELEKL